MLLFRFCSSRMQGDLLVRFLEEVLLVRAKPYSIAKSRRFKSGRGAVVMVEQPIYDTKTPHPNSNRIICLYRKVMDYMSLPSGNGLYVFTVR